MSFSMTFVCTYTILSCQSKGIRALSRVSMPEQTHIEGEWQKPDLIWASRPIVCAAKKEIVINSD